MLAVKKLLLKWALRRAQKRFAELDREFRGTPHFMRGFDKLCREREDARWRFYGLVHKLERLNK